MNKTKVLIVDDHSNTRMMVRGILEKNNKSIEIIGEAKNQVEALDQVHKKNPDIVLMDISLPMFSGIDATKEIISHHSTIKVVALSDHTDEKFVKEMLQAGASGYMVEDELPDELMIGINAIIKGDMYISSRVTEVALGKNGNGSVSIENKILLSKLLRPPIIPDYVIRSEIIQNLEHNILKPLSLIAAGAGFGKSITISQWLERTNHLKSWISLDQEHNDLRTFLNYLVASVERIFPGKLEKTRTCIISTILPSVKEIARILINELCEIDDYFILVLDDYHLITEPKIHDILNEWVHFAPSSVHLCIITRRDPPLNIKSMKLSGRITEIRMNELSFSRAEILELFKLYQFPDLDDQVLDIIHDKTEGWIIALRLVSMFSNDQKEIGERLKSMPGELISISQYLLTEVLSKYSEQFNNQLIKSSILDKFCSELIEEIYSTDPNIHIKDDGLKPIEYLLKTNLFIIPLDSDQKWFRFHHLFQEFLLDQLKAKEPEHQIADLHIKASRWYEKNGFINEAIEHVSKSHDTEQLIKVICRNWEQALDKDHWDSVEKWLALLPEKEIIQSKELLFARLWVSHRLHRVKQIALSINQLEQLNVNFTDKERGYLNFAKCLISYFGGAPANEVLSLARQAQQLIPHKFASFQASIPIYIFFSLQSLGQIEKALQFVETNVKNAEIKEEPLPLMRSKIHLGYYSLFNADLSRLQYAVKSCFKIPVLTGWISGHAWYLKQCIGWWSYDPEQVILATENLAQCKYVSAFREVIDVYTCRILAYQELNKSTEARQELNKAYEYANEREDTTLIESCEARLNILQGNLDAAIQWLDKTESRKLDPTMLFWVEVAEITRCRVLIERGSSEDLLLALNLLSQYRAYSESMHNTLRITEIIVLQAITLKKIGKKQDAVETLKEGLELVERGEWIRPFASHSEEISDLLLHIKDSGVCQLFINRIFEAVEKVKKTSSNIFKSPHRSKNKKKNTQFTPREFEILRYISEGYRNQEIAEKLFISQETIKKHINNMFHKMHVKNRMSLVTASVEMGLLRL